MDIIEKLPIPAIVSLIIIAICYVAAEGYKRMGVHKGVIPLISAGVGCLLGALVFVILPAEFIAPITSIGNAVFVGGAYGALCTWLYETFKNFKDNKFKL